MIVTSHGRPGHLKRALAAGVRGFVPKTVSRAAARRRSSVPCMRETVMWTRSWRPTRSAAGDSPLTAREAEVLEFAADGAPVAEIAERAALSQGTVRNYLSSAASKLGRGEPSRGGAPRAGARLGIVGSSRHGALRT